jgi:hypothetical protein
MILRPNARSIGAFPSAGINQHQQIEPFGSGWLGIDRVPPSYRGYIRLISRYNKGIIGPVEPSENPPFSSGLASILTLAAKAFIFYACKGVFLRASAEGIRLIGVSVPNWVQG